MRIARLTLTDFRNYHHLVWTPEHQVNVLFGENGSGKTNFLEAISLLVPGRGLRGAATSDFPRVGCNRWGVAARLTQSDGETEIGTGNPTETSLATRQFRLDGTTLRSRAIIAEHLACVWLTPQMDRLLHDGASARRRFLDRLVVALEPYHARELAAYERSLAQRNRLLGLGSGDGAWYAGIEDSMARHAVAATAARLSLTTRLAALDGVGEGFPEPGITLVCPIALRLTGSPALAVEDWLRESWAATRDDDRKRGATKIGAHRADVLFSDRATSRPAQQSSTGQQKAMLLGVIFAHARLIARIRGNAPVILLDEPLVHLDDARRGALMRAIASLDTPVLVTGTDAEPFAPLGGQAAFLRVHAGGATREKMPLCT